MYGNKIILIGAMGVGKSSVAKELAKRMNMQYIDIDELRWDYFAQFPDYDEKKVDELFATENEIAAFQYFKPFEAKFTVSVLQKFSSGVFDFGAGYTVYNDENLFSMVKSAFSPYKNVILLRYSTNAAESFEALRSRHADVPEKIYNTLNTEFINSPCNEILATQIINTKGLSVNEIVDVIIPQLHTT